MKRLLAFLVCLTFGIGAVFAQNITASGVVVDELGDEVIGATVVLKGSKTGTATGMDGDFKLQVPEGSTLVFSMVGMKTEERKAGTNMRVVMENETSVLDEVVVTGYGTVKKSSFTGSASVISTAVLEEVPVVNLDAKLAGAAAGVSVGNSSGQPGGVESLRIRGAGSIMASNEPLYVIDGVPVNTENLAEFGYSESGTSSLSTLNSNDIESITIIKDAGAAAMYGSRAANGVVVITTKNGKVGRTNVQVRANWGFSNQAINYRPTLNGRDRREMLFFGLENYAKNDPDIKDPNKYAHDNIEKYASVPWSGYTNWKDVLMKTGSQSSYEASVQTGSETFNAFSSLAYNKNDGIFDRSGFERYAGRLNATFTGMKNLRVDVSSTFSRTKQDTYAEGTSFSSPIMALAFTVSPSDYPYNEDGSINITQGFPALSKPLANTLQSAKYNYSQNDINRFLGSVAAKYDIYNGLYAKQTLSYDNISTGQEVWWSPYTNDGSASDGVLQIFRTNFRTLTSQTHVGFVNTFNKVHNVDAVVGYEIEKHDNDYILANGSGFPDPDLNIIDNASTTKSYGSYQQRRMISYLASGNYNYNDTYYVGASIRRDGSSKFHRKHRWGDFWSLSGSWRVSNQEFFESAKTYVQDLRLRLSYGVNGNLPVSNYAYMSTYTFGNMYFGQQGTGPSRLAYKELTWEKNKAVNGGIDVAFLDRFNLVLDLYSRTTDDLLIPLAISSATGFTAININKGKISNKGVELSLRSNNIVTSDFSWSTTLNLAHNRNRLVYIDGDRRQMQVGSSVLINKVGHPFNSFYMLEYAGVDRETGKESFYTNSGENPREITTDASKASIAIGKQVDPRLTGGLINNLSYKGFDLGITMTFTLGGHGYNSASWVNADGGIYNYTGNIPSFYKIKDTWTKDNKDAKYPQFAYGNSSRTSTRWIFSTDHLRIKNVTLGYTIPRNLYRNTGISNIRLFSSAVNLLTFKPKNVVVDPELPSNRNGGIGSYGVVTFQTPPLRTVTFGVDLTF